MVRNPALGLGAIAAVAVLLIGCSTPSGAPSTSPDASVQASPNAVTETLTGGRYLFGPFEGVTIEATGPDGWFGYPSWAMDGPLPVRADAPDGIGISFITANGLYSDPCHWDVQGTGQAVVGDVEVGPSVDDLVTGLRANTYYTSTDPTPVTIDGYAGQELTLQLPDESFASCDKDDPNDPAGRVFVFSGPGLYAQGPANSWHLFILDVDGTRLITVILAYAGTPEADLDLAESVVDTMDVNP